MMSRSGWPVLVALVAPVLITIVFTPTGYQGGFRPDDSLWVLFARDTIGSPDAVLATCLPDRPFSPLAVLTLSLDATGWPREPSRFFLINVLLHSINCAMLLRLAWGMTGGIRAGWIAVGVLAASPAALPNLFSVAMRGPILSLTFLLAALLLIRLSETRPGAFLPAVVSFAASLLSCSWAILATPVVVWSVGSRRAAIRVVPFLAVLGGYLFAFLPSLTSAGFTPLREWSVPRLIGLAAPFVQTPPNPMLRDVSVGLAGAVLLLAGLGGLSSRSLRFELIGAVLWVAPGIAVRDAGMLDPVRLNLGCLYMFLPGVALILAALGAAALQSTNRQTRVLATLLIVGLMAGYLRLSSVFSIVAIRHSEMLARRLDQVEAAIKSRKSQPRLALVLSFNPVSDLYWRETRRYLGTLLLCRVGAETVLPQVLGVADGGYVLSAGPTLTGLETRPIGRSGLAIASITNGEEILDDPRAVLYGVDFGTVAEVDLRAPKLIAAKLGARYPHWESSLADWQKSDLTATGGDDAFRMVSGYDDPHLTSPRFMWPAAAVERLRLRLTVERADPGELMRVYWESSKHAGFDEEHAANMQLPAVSDQRAGTESAPVDVYLASYMPWLTAEYITRIRIDPPAGSILRLRSVALLPSTGDAPTGTAVSRVVWTDRDIDHLSRRQFEPLEAGGCFRSAGDDPAIFGPVTVDPITVDAVRIRMTCSAETGPPEQVGQIYWITPANPRYSEDRRMEFAVMADGLERVYTVPVGFHYGWLTAGSVEGMRLDPMQSPGTCCVVSVGVVGPSEDGSAGATDRRPMP
ncbi:MAG: hypothetical protein HYX75_22095 [Acidobacteria bacterium]|nr:hypothetical protein [Acidobacteriota bacterium]